MKAVGRAEPTFVAPNLRRRSRSGDVLPVHAAHDETDESVMHTEIGGNCPLRFTRSNTSTDLVNLNVCEFGIPVALPERFRAVLPLVLHVRCMRVPAQVGQRVVQAPARTVTRLHALGARAYECFKDQAVYVVCLPSAVTREPDPEVVTPAHRYEQDARAALAPAVGAVQRPTWPRSETSYRPSYPTTGNQDSGGV